jgi:phosphonopyruvate decarboxylase
MMVASTTASFSLAARFLAALERSGFDFFTGVPCSLLSSFWTLLERLPAGRYVPAVREDSALGLAAGAWLGGRRPCVLMQNSGLGVSVNALASLHLLYEIPALLVITWRGEGGSAGAPAGSTAPEGFVDAPEHWIMGEITRGQLDLLGIPWAVLDPARIEEQVRDAAATLETTRRPAALIVRKGIFDGGD